MMRKPTLEISIQHSTEVLARNIGQEKSASKFDMKK